MLLVDRRRKAVAMTSVLQAPPLDNPLSPFLVDNLKRNSDDEVENLKDLVGFLFLLLPMHKNACECP